MSDNACRTSVHSSRFVENTFSCHPYYEMAKESHFWIIWRFRVFQQRLHLFGNLLEHTLNGLDVGCGNGVVRRQIEQVGAWTVDGIDIVESVLRLNHTKRGQTFYYDVDERRPSLKEAYDFIILFDVLEHIQDTLPFLESLLYHLKPAGWLFINVPALNWLFCRYDVAQNHVRRYTKRMMREELAQHAVTIQDMRYWGLSLLPFAIIRKFRSYSNLSAAEVLKKGFTPPKAWMNTWLLNCMRLETAVLKSAVVGSSLMIFARKL